MRAWCVLVAAGRGARSGLKQNKVFFSLNGRTVLSRCLDALAGSGAFEGIVLVLNPQDMEIYRETSAREGECALIKRIVQGGATRRESVYSGLRALPQDIDIVAVHDAARPFVTRKIILSTIEDAARYKSGVISTPVVDTIKIVNPETETVITPERERLRAVQTPQTFDFRMLMEAHRRAEQEGWSVTDDAMLFEKMYGNVHLSSAEGAEKNIKLTNPQDFARPAAPVMRIGSGYDAHRLAEGRKLILCGVEVPHGRGLDGHSDADVAVHALMDAILGALGERDIGKHFPDSDMRYKGISSMLLLEHVMGLVRDRGLHVVNADITIVAQKPKLASYIDAMRENVARAMGVDVSCANVKATTTEHMGFEGEEIGISAQAVVLLQA